MGLRPRQPVAARVGHRLQGRRRRLQHPGQHRGARSHDENGTWPVYARYTVTTMPGTNPDGSHYVDPGIPWVSYFHGGDALHGFVRGSYGFPRATGASRCRSPMPQTVFPLTPLGTLVTVQA